MSIISVVHIQTLDLLMPVYDIHFQCLEIY